MIGCLVQHAVLEALPQNAEDLVFDHFVTPELLVRFEHAHRIVLVALVDGRYAPIVLVVPRVRLLIGRHNGFWQNGEKK